MTITQSSTRLVALTLGVAAVVAIALSVAIATPAHAAGICPGTTFSVNLKQGATSGDVMKLQQFLNMDPDTTVALTGAGSAGSETTYFGALTTAAVKKFQAKYAAQILTPLGLTTPTPNFYASSRAQANALCAGSTTSPTNPTVPVTGNGLKVVLSPDSPNNVALVQGQAAGTLAKFTFVNPTNASIMVTNLSFKRIGVSNDSTLSNVYLYNGAVRLTDSAGVTNSAFNFNNPAGLFTVAPGSTYTVTVNSDIAGSTSGQQVGVQLVSVGATGTLDTNTSFPINSFTQTISAATLAAVDFGATTLPSVGNVDPQADYTVWQNTVNVNTRAVWLKSFALRNIGSVQNGDVRNFRLYVDGVMVGSAVAGLDVNSMVTFDLSANPVTLNTGGRVIKVLADVVGGASRTFDFSLRYPADAIMVDSNLGQPVLPTAAGATFSVRTSGVQTINSISNSAPSVTRASDSPNSNVSVGATNVKLASFKMLASGEDVKVTDLNVQADTSVSNGGLQNVAVFVNGVQVGSTKNVLEATPTNFTFGSSLILKAGTISTIDVYADAKTSTSTNLVNGETAQISLTAGNQNGQGQISLSSTNVPASTVSGNVITLASSALSATKASGYGNQTMIAGSQNAKIGSFTLSAGSTEGINVNTIDIGFASAVSSTISDLMLKDNSTGTQIGSSKSTVNTTNSYSVNLAIPASGTKTIDIYANIKTSANAGAMTPAQVKFDTAGTGASTGNSVQVAATSGGDVNLQTITIGGATLSAAVDTGSTPDSANVIAGSSLVKVGSFRFTAQYSPFTIDKLTVKVPAGAATSVSSVIVKYPDSTGTTQTATQALSLPSGAQTEATSSFTGLSFFVPQNDSKDVDVYVSIPTISSGASTGAQITASIDYNDGFNTTDSAGNASTTITTTSGDLASNSISGKGVAVVRKSAPTLSSVALDSTTFTPGPNTAIGRVKVSADSAGDIGWKKIVFAVNKSTAVTIGATSTITLWDGPTQVQGTFATSTAAAPSVDAFGGATSGSLVFIATNEQQIAAGSSRTYELRAGTLATGGTGSQFISVSIPQTAASVVTGTFAGLNASIADTTESLIWTDRSSINTVHSEGTSDWTNDFLVKTLPLSIGTQTGSF